MIRISKSISGHVLDTGIWQTTDPVRPAPGKDSHGKGAHGGENTPSSAPNGPRAPHLPLEKWVENKIKFQDSFTFSLAYHEIK